MKVTDHIKKANGKTLFSFEIIPPVKGHKIQELYDNINPLMEFEPPFIDVTTSREEYVYLDRSGLLDKKLTIFGSFVSMFKDVTIEEMSNPIKLVNRAGKLVINAKAVSQFELCDHILAPKVLSNYSLFDTKSMKKIYEIGYHETHDYLSKMM